MRILISTLAAASLLFAASSASAVTFSVVGVSTSSGSSLEALLVGEEFTIDIRVSADADEVHGLSASVFGYNDSLLQFVSGEAVSSIFHEVATPGIGAFNGLTNLVSNPLVESAIGANGNRVHLFDGVALSPHTDNPLDPGLDGVVGGMDAQFRVTFAMVSPGSTTLIIGTGYEGDGVVLPGGQLIQQANAATVSVTIAPEPGTALLIGLGLAGLTAARRRD